MWKIIQSNHLNAFSSPLTPLGTVPSSYFPDLSIINYLCSLRFSFLELETLWWGTKSFGTLLSKFYSPNFGAFLRVQIFCFSSFFKFSPLKELIYSPLSTTISILGITSLSLSLALNFVPNSTSTFSLNALHYFTTQTQLIVFPLNISSCYCIFCPAPHDVDIVLIVWSQNCKLTYCFSFFPEWLIPYQLFWQWFCQLFY